MITPQNLVRHELIGLKVRIPDSSDKEIAGMEGVVVDETRNTLVIETGRGEERTLIKGQCVFSFFLPETKKWVRVEGDVLVARPEDRIKKKLRKW
jgi:ribonuclease P protein subunit POP4